MVQKNDWNAAREHVCQIQMFRNELMSCPRRQGPINPEGKSPTFIHSVGEKYADFFLFDYYDCLRVPRIRDQILSYNDIIASLSSQFPLEDYAQYVSPVLATNLVTLVDAPGAQGERDNPFLDPDGYAPSAYSDTPFLALIMLTLNGDSYQAANKEEKKEAKSLKWIDGILEKLIKCIENEIKECGLPEGTRSRAYFSANSGDIMAVVRLRRIADAYKIAWRFRAGHLSYALAPGYNEIKMNTFTTIACEMRANGEGYAKWNDPGLVKINEGATALLRLRVKGETMRALQAHGQGFADEHSEPKTRADGLFGHYDALVRLPFPQFMLLYPYLCGYKFAPCGCGELDQSDEDGMDAVTKIVVRGLVDRDIELANERLCVQMDGTSMVGDAADNDVKAQQRRQKRMKFVQEVHEQIAAFRDRAHELPFGRRIYQETVRLLSDMVTIYSSIDNEVESACSGNDFHVIVSDLFASIDNYFNYLEKLRKYVHSGGALKETLDHAYIGLLDDLTRSLDDVGNFFKLIYLNNLQTIQMPQYEIDSRINARKFVLAYSEFVHRIVQSHEVWYDEVFPGRKGADGRDKPISLTPILLIDHSSNLRANGLFREPSNTWRRPYRCNGVSNPLVVSIGASSLESIARMFDLVPSLMHEIAHFRRMLPRPARNRFVVEMIADHLSMFIAKRYIASVNDHRKYSALANVQVCIAKSVREAILDICDIESWKEMNFSDLCEAIIAFYLELVFKRGGNAGGDPGPSASSAQVVRDALSAIGSVLDDASPFYAESEAIALRLLKALDSADEIDVSGAEKSIDATCGVLMSNSNHFIKTELRKVRKDLAEKARLTLEQFNLLLYLTRYADESEIAWLPEIKERLATTGRVVTDERGIVVEINKPLFDLLTYAAIDIYHQVALTLARIGLAKEKKDEKAEQTSDLVQYCLDPLAENLGELLDDSSEANKWTEKLEAALFNRDSKGDSKYRLYEMIYSVIDRNWPFEKRLLTTRREIEDSTAALARLLEESAPHGDVERRKAAARSVRSIMDVVDGALHKLIDLHNYHAQILLHLGSDRRVDIAGDWLRNRFISGVRERLNARLFEDEKPTSRFLLAPRTVNSMVNPLSAYGDDAFQQSFVHGALEIDDDAVRDAVLTWKEYYAEASSDLFMCATMGFNSFSYFMFYEKAYTNSRYQEPMSHEFKINRLLLLLCVLLKAEGAACYPLYDKDEGCIETFCEEGGACEECESFKCYVDASRLGRRLAKYADQQLKYIVGETRAALTGGKREPDGNESAFLSLIEKFLTKYKGESKISQPINLEFERSMQDELGFQWDALPNGPAARERLYGLFDRWVLYMDLRKVFKTEAKTISVMDGDETKEILAFVSRGAELKHFSDLYVNLNEDAKRMFLKGGAPEPSCAAVAQWFSGEQMDDGEMLLETLRFILRYYYLHQFRLQELPDQESD